MSATSAASTSTHTLQGVRPSPLRTVILQERGVFPGLPRSSDDGEGGALGGPCDPSCPVPAIFAYWHLKVTLTFDVVTKEGRSPLWRQIGQTGGTSVGKNEWDRTVSISNVPQNCYTAPPHPQKPQRPKLELSSFGLCFLVVGVAGFEPTTSCSRSKRSSQAELHPERGALSAVHRGSSRRPSPRMTSDGGGARRCTRQLSNSGLKCIALST